jgi:hypothetical protein
MRKTLIAVIVAAALFAVGAFAASFTVRSEDVASGSNPVAACASEVDITFNEPTYSLTGVWTSTEATATFYNRVAGVRQAAIACNGFDADLALDIDTNGDGVADATAGHTSPNAQVATNAGVTTATFAISVDVGKLVGASVVVDGAFLAAPL